MDLFTSESVTEGHPDKVADQVSDAILDAMLTQDPLSRVAAETMVSTGLIVVSGEITTSGYVDLQRVIRDTVIGIGYDRAEVGFDGHTCAVLTAIDEQSPDIARGVDHALGSEDAIDELGAGDQGMVFGFACDDTPELMPLPIALAHRLAKRLGDVRRHGQCDFLWPDGKTQVTVAYDHGQPAYIDTVVVSSQHAPTVEQRVLQEAIRDLVVGPILPTALVRSSMRLLINPTGRFVVGGPQADSGLTGRKIIVDTYGGYARHGGGAFSGKDPTKVDRSAAYAARWVAKNIVAAGLARRCEIQVAYAIGVARPVSLRVDSFGTGRRSDEELAALVTRVFDLRPGAIIRDLDLRRPLYRQTAAYGHFGRVDTDLPWERMDRVVALQEALASMR